MSQPAVLATVLACLPGASADPGTGPAEPAVLDGLLDHAAPGEPAAAAAALAAHRDLLAGPARDLAGLLVVPAVVAVAVRDALTGSDHGLRILLATDTTDRTDPLDRLRAARADLLDVDGLELAGVRVPLPGGPAAEAAHDLLAELDSSAPTWVVLPPAAPDETAAALAVLAEDGAEHAAVDLAAGDDPANAALLRALVDADTAFRVAGAAGAVRAPDHAAPGVLNVLCATRAALNGADVAELAAVLATTDPALLASAVRRMSEADAAVTRSFLVGVAVPDAAAVAGALDALGLLPAD